MREFSAEWGSVRVGRILRPEESPEGGWELPDWTELVGPGEDGGYHHGTCGSEAPDTIVLTLDGVLVARCAGDHISLRNLYVEDGEYYMFLRLHEVLDEPLWAETPWRGLGPGQVFFAWDKYHDIAYARTEGADPQFSYGGDWAHLEAQVLAEYPHDFAPEKSADAPPASVHLLCELIRSGDIERLQGMLRNGADPNGPTAPMNHAGVSAPYSFARTDTPLWVAVQNAAPAVTRLLLEHGAEVNYQPTGHMTALHGAILMGRLDHIPVLLAHGAAVSALWQGHSATALAEEKAPEALPLLRK